MIIFQVLSLLMFMMIGVQIIFKQRNKPNLTSIDKFIIILLLSISSLDNYMWIQSIAYYLVIIAVIIKLFNMKKEKQIKQ